MARSAVGGKMVLFQGIFFLDVGVSIWALADNLSIYLVIYIAAMNIFAGLVAVLRGRESRSTGSRHWRLTTAYGVTSILIAAIVVSAVLVLGGPIWQSMPMLSEWPIRVLCRLLPQPEEPPLYTYSNTVTCFWLKIESIIGSRFGHLPSGAAFCQLLT